jgi:CHAD domain-containing protein
LARSLGDARDQDVQIAFLCDLLSRLQELPFVAGVARVLVRWERRREKLQPEVVRAMRRLLSSHILREMLVATKKLSVAGCQLPVAGKTTKKLSVASCQLSVAEKVTTDNSELTTDNCQLTTDNFSRAEEQILSRLKELRALEPCLADPLDRRQHHAMRIAAKRLRYTLEICRPMYAGRADGVLESIKEVQSLLGDVHDCDVWMDQLDAFAARQAKRLQILFGHPGPLVRVKAGIDYLRQDRCRRRGELFSTLSQYWRDLTRESLWEGLAQTVRGWRGTGDGRRGTGDGEPLCVTTDPRPPAANASTAHPSPPATRRPPPVLPCNPARN